jgi:hypothetical protein
VQQASQPAIREQFADGPPLFVPRCRQRRWTGVVGGTLPPHSAGDVAIPITAPPLMPQAQAHRLLPRQRIFVQRRIECTHRPGERSNILHGAHIFVVQTLGQPHICAAVQGQTFYASYTSPTPVQRCNDGPSVPLTSRHLASPTLAGSARASHRHHAHAGQGQGL